MTTSISCLSPLPQIAADISRKLGEEFPMSREAMVGWQFTALVEEGNELDDELVGGDFQKLREEFADALLSAYLLAHYFPRGAVDVSYRMDRWFAEETDPPIDCRAPSTYIKQLAKPLRRASGVARRPGEWLAVEEALARVVLSVVFHADRVGVDLATAVSDKVSVIFARGWKATLCGSCSEPITGHGWFHSRLGVHVHGDARCQINLKGEDVRGHCMVQVAFPDPKAVADVSRS
jgi:NTP pyrophosphatase (non-canonical NTP hydrolase)